MPFINLKTNVKIEEKKEVLLKERLGALIAVIPGKSEAWLMVNFEDGCRMYFKGENKPVAFFEVKVFGSVQKKAADELTAKLSDTAAELLGIEKDRVYVKYEEVEYWGWNGFNL